MLHFQLILECVAGKYGQNCSQDVVDIAKIQWLVTKALESVMEDALTDGDGPCVIKVI